MFFGLFKKPCEHKNKKYTGIDLTSQGIDQYDTYIGDCVEPIYYCKDCRVLLVPLEKQYLKKRNGEKQ